MKAIRYYAPKDIRVENLPKPVPTEGQALIKILYSGICGSDLHIYRMGMFMTHAPETLGHEFIGKIIQAPENSGLQPGDIVTGNPGVYCHSCNSCKKQDYIHCENLTFIGEVCPGCDAEYMVIDYKKLIKFSPDIDILEAAVVEPLTVAHHACKSASRYLQDEAVVFGCGPIGLLIGYLLKNMYKIPKLVMVDTNQYRRNQAIKIGFDEVVDKIEHSSILDFSTVVDTTGSASAFNSELTALKPNGTLIIVSIFEKLPIVDINTIVNKELNIIGSNAYTFNDMKEAVKIIESKKYTFKWLISKIVNIDDANNAFESLSYNPSELKILFDFTK